MVRHPVTRLMDTKMVSLIIDDRKIETNAGSTILDAAKAAGIRIPTLCHHPALASYGSCRLCAVEIAGRPKLAASCAYPVEEGIEVKTTSPRVLKARKLVMSLLLLRCPDVPKLKELAEQIEVDEAVVKRFKPDSEKCILCGLCARVCRERMGVGAIDFVNRGYKRKISPPFGEFSPVCVTCGACEVVCPTGAVNLSEITKNKPRPIPSEYNAGLVGRGAIYIPFAQAIPKVPVIDRNTCMHFLKDVCKSCENFCGPKAINYDQEDEIIDIEAGAVIVASGGEIIDPQLKQELGYGRYPNVISSLQFERLLSASGPHLGKVLRPSDLDPPKRIAFIQCVGSREIDSNYCSSVCCMYATKEAIIVKEHEPDTECTIFYIDLRAFGKGFEAYYNRAKEIGVKYVRCRPSFIKEVPATRNLLIQYQGKGSQIATGEFDLVVLSMGLRTTPEEAQLARILDIHLNEHGFVSTNETTPTESSRQGIYVAGLFSGPKDIPESVTEASAAAAKVMGFLAEERGKLITEKSYPPERDVTGQEPRIGVFVCHCGRNIGGYLNVPQVVEYAKTLPDVNYAEDNLYTCSTDTQQAIKDRILEYGLNRVVVASCTPRTHEPLFQDTLREAGLNPYLFEMANIRDQCSWVHMHDPAAATQKAKDLVRMAVAKARLLDPLYPQFVNVVPRGLVIGGGMAGMTAALDLAEQGFETYLLEKSYSLGGNMRRLKFLMNGDDPQEWLNTLIEKVTTHPKIRVYTEAEISDFQGSVGNFKTGFIADGKAHTIDHGIVIVATGAQEYKPQEYTYGQDPRVITQFELEEKLANGDFNASSVIMVQCVGSREEPQTYCSRVCCAQAVKNSMKIKERNPKANVFILNRDVRTYGFDEAYYRKAREAGVGFIRFDEGHKPQVASNNGHLVVSVDDSLLDMILNIDCDAIILSAGTVVPRDDTANLAQKLKIPLTQDGFLLEAHMKLRPVDFASEGIYLCGLAHGPKTLSESIIQASAAAARASTVLSKQQIQLEPRISQVVDENCDGCAYCIEPCSYNALTLVEYMKDGAVKKTVEADSAKCRGCGVCQATCPKKGIFIRNFRLEQLSAMMEAALAR